MENVLTKYPELQSEIRRLSQEDEDFQEMCQDYEEVCSLMANLTATADRHPATMEGYQKLLESLSEEIMEALQERTQVVVSPEDGSSSRPKNYMEKGGRD